MDLTVIERHGYTILDIFSDLGGLLGFLIKAISIFLSIWNYNYLDSILVSKLYKAGPGPKEDDKPSCIERLVPSKLVCRRKKRQ